MRQSERSEFRHDVCILIIVVLLFCVHISLLDGLSGAILSLFLPESTEFSCGYSYCGFVLVSRGDTKEEVLEKLGPPLFTGANGYYWFYSYSPEHTNYRYRAIFFDSGWTVSDKLSYLYLD